MELRPQLLQLLRTKDYVPMRREEIFAILKIGSKEIAGAHSLLDEMLERGEVARLKKDKICIPDDADLVSGRIMFRQNGINLTLYRLNEVVAGDLSCIVEPLMQEHQADLLAAMGDE